jgi:hypothetical protein
VSREVELRLVARLGFLAALACLFISPAFSSPAFASCEYVIAGKSFWIRLLDPVASYSSKPGTTVRAVLIQSPECDSRPVFPAGLEVVGKISKVRKVGLGFVHDSAYVEIQFEHLPTPAGQVLPLAAEVVEVDNAREAVRSAVSPMSSLLHVKIAPNHHKMRVFSCSDAKTLRCSTESS